jgi:hypothetical protein
MRTICIGVLVIRDTHMALVLKWMPVRGSVATKQSGFFIYKI